MRAIAMPSADKIFERLAPFSRPLDADRRQSQKGGASIQSGAGARAHFAPFGMQGADGLKPQHIDKIFVSIPHMPPHFKRKDAATRREIPAGESNGQEAGGGGIQKPF